MNSYPPTLSHPLQPATHPLQARENLLFKRISDVLLASFFLLLLWPLLLLIALAVRLSSPGPALFQQERVTRDGQIFRMYKFRTMPVDTEAGSGPIWATADDPRPTALGAILRRSSLDELPQLLNVLGGSMSFVGPRPERPFFVERFSHTIPGYTCRHQVKAGLTGLAQIHGLRGDTSIEERVRYDLEYIENWSLTRDAWIILQSFWVVVADFIQRKAY